MGQAKKRGTFEERRQQSIDKSEMERLERQREEKEWWDSLTEEQKETVLANKKQRAKNMQALAAWMGLGILLGG